MINIETFLQKPRRDWFSFLSPEQDRKILSFQGGGGITTSQGSLKEVRFCPEKSIFMLNFHRHDVYDVQISYINFHRYDVKFSCQVPWFQANTSIWRSDQPQTFRCDFATKREVTFSLLLIISYSQLAVFSYQILLSY